MDILFLSTFGVLYNYEHLCTNFWMDMFLFLLDNI